MKKYILLEDAINTVRRHGILGEGHSDKERENDVVDMLEEVSVRDVQEIRYGHWITSKNPDDPYTVTKTCSECKVEIELANDIFPLSFCPSCGAMMRRKKPQKKEATFAEKQNAGGVRAATPCELFW